MKKVILLALTALMVGCEEKQSDGTYPTIATYYNYIEDSCEYVGYVMGSRFDFLAHKGNCRFCKERDSIKWEKRKKELLEELVIRLKEE